MENRRRRFESDCSGTDMARYRQHETEISLKGGPMSLCAEPHSIRWEQIGKRSVVKNEAC